MHLSCKWYIIIGCSQTSKSTAPSIVECKQNGAIIGCSIKFCIKSDLCTSYYGKKPNICRHICHQTIACLDALLPELDAALISASKLTQVPAIIDACSIIGCRQLGASI